MLCSTWQSAPHSDSLLADLIACVVNADASAAAIALAVAVLPQWENLLHLDTIKARSKPLQPPKKPEAAPFFLPTVPTLAGQPTFDTDAAEAGGANGAAAAHGDVFPAIDDITHDFDDSDDDGGNAGSRVMRSRKGAASAAAAPSPFMALLRGSAAAGDFAGFMSHVRTLSPAALDRELRAMMILGPGDDVEDAQQQQEVADVGLLLEALLAELDAARNFEMVQALMSRVLTVSGMCCRLLGCTGLMLLPGTFVAWLQLFTHTQLRCGGQPGLQTSISTLHVGAH